MSLRYLPFLLLGLVGCSSAEVSHSLASQERIDKEFDYAGLIDTNTKKDAKYDGFHEAFQYKATLLTSKMIEAQIHKKAALQLWDAEKLEQEKTRKMEESAVRTEMFLSFFSPQQDVNNLESKKTVWRAYLDVDGRRYIGEIKKSHNTMADIVAIYPYHDRWSTPYVITFPVPLSVVEQHTAKFTLTGSLGTSTVQLN